MKLLTILLGTGLFSLALASNATECEPHECWNELECVPYRWTCDGKEDCEDGSDERAGCPCDGVSCPNRRCIRLDNVCDGENHCGDFEDETDCEVCRGYECANSRICIPKDATCDGNNDCGDDSDETEEACPCTDAEFRCGNFGSNTPGKCIPKEQVCDEDDIWDCPDGSDEANCTIPIFPK